MGSSGIDVMNDTSPTYIIYPCDTEGCKHSFMATAKSFVVRPERLCPRCLEVTRVTQQKLNLLFFKHFEDMRKSYHR
jgi:hypothetical protein